jgi:chemotaxis protein MotB
MATTRQLQPIIRKKKKKGGDDGHHGGAWKIAYADFVTAMMAFFLLMWLINVTSPEQKTGIAEYFNPITVSQTTAGSGGVLDGTTLSAPGPLTSDSAEMRIESPLPFAPRSTIKEEQPKTEQEKQEELAKAAEEALRKKEEEAFKAVEEKLMESVAANPELKLLIENVIIDYTPEGLRIQIVDRDDRPMFPLGDPAPFDYTADLLRLVTSAIGDLPNRVSIRGHTDALPYSSSRDYDNWDLSAERALASRRIMRDAGLAEGRLEGVVGRADTDPLFPNDPMDERNRRISIILLRESGAAAPSAAAAAMPSEETAVQSPPPTMAPAIPE